MLAAAPAVAALNQNPSAQISYTEFKQQVTSNNVTSVTFHGRQVDGTVRSPVTDDRDRTLHASRFTTVVPDVAGEELEALLEQHKVQVTADPSGQDNLPVNLLLFFGPVLLLGGLFWWLMRRNGGLHTDTGLFGMGQTKARVWSADLPHVTFADVAGIDEAVSELREVVDYLKQPFKYQRLGGRAPTGVLLVGPPGTGKTLLAKAVAGEAGVPFFSMGASEFVEMIVGVGASRVRDLFTKARAAAPAIIFIDELDAVGRNRAASLRVGGHDETEQTLNQILSEMDGFSGREGVIVLAATNRPDVLDPALLRPGRFDRRVMVQPPDRSGRAAILRIHAARVPLEPDVDLDQVAAHTPGLVGADLANLVNEAALLAARRRLDSVTMKEFEDALEKVMLGQERHIALSIDDRRRIAIHEAGHALVALLTPGADPVTRVSIVPRGAALGVTVQSPVDDRWNYPEEYLRARLVTALGGRAAEGLVYGTFSTGAENDLQVVTRIARDMVTRWGMSQAVGPLQVEVSDAGTFNPQPLSEATLGLVDHEIRSLIETSDAQARALLEQHRAALDQLANRLLAEESLDGEMVDEIVCPRPHTVDSPSPAPSLVAAV